MTMSHEAMPQQNAKVEIVEKDKSLEQDSEKAAFAEFSKDLIFKSDELKGSIDKKSKLAKLEPEVAKDFDERIDSTVIESHIEAMFAGKEKPEWAKDPVVQTQMKELVGNLIKKSNPEHLKEALDSASSLVSQFYDPKKASLIDSHAISTINKVVEILPGDQTDQILDRFVGFTKGIQSPEASKDISAMSAIPDFIKRRVMSRTLEYVDYAVEKAHDPETASHVLEGIIDVLENENISKLKLALSFSEVDIDNVITTVKYIKENTQNDKELADSIWKLYSYILNETEISLTWLEPENKMAEKFVHLGNVVDQKFKEFSPKEKFESFTYTNLANPGFKPSDLDKITSQVKSAKSTDEIYEIFNNYNANYLNTQKTASAY